MRNNYKLLSETKSDEGEADGALAVALQDLKQIPSLFFDPEHEDNFAERDDSELNSGRHFVSIRCKHYSHFPSAGPTEGHF
ncbi:hypothetical protein RJ639_041392 [Escallonia herrerae]|uniref:Uncharacterized protein n=1 Tax=Escallonia herrerae TaxID=1293975 RepID=A0AA88WIE9_9ASTE|nr:hypothetical protein RJ639_041392 [Escallonia herrerae]